MRQRYQDVRVSNGAKAYQEAMARKAAEDLTSAVVSELFFMPVPLHGGLFELTEVRDSVPVQRHHSGIDIVSEPTITGMETAVLASAQRIDKVG